MSEKKYDHFESTFTVVAFFFIIIVVVCAIWHLQYDSGYNDAKMEWQEECINKGYLKFSVDEKTGYTYFLWLKPETGKFEQDKEKE